MGLLDRIKSVGSKGLEVTKMALYSPIAVAGWTRTKVGALLWGDIRGASADKASVYPALKTLDYSTGAGPVEQAERRVLADKRSELRDWARGYIEPHANRIGEKEDLLLIRGEKDLHDRYSSDIQKEQHVEAKAPTIMERMALRKLTEYINDSRPAGSPITLLSSKHPVSTLSQKRATLFSHKGIQHDAPPLNLLLYPPLSRDKVEKTGFVSYTWPKKKPRFDLSGEERRRAAQAPEISADKQSHRTLLHERDEDYAQRIRANLSASINTESKVISTEVSLGDREYPIGGDPSLLYEKLFLDNGEDLNNTHWTQMSISMVRRGKKITLSGFLTKGQANVPETMPEPVLPNVFDDDWWMEQAGKSLERSAPFACRNEADLISYTMQDPSRIKTDLKDLKAEDFQEEKHQILYKALQIMEQAGTNVTPRSLTAQVISMGKIAEVGRRPYINSLYFKALPPAFVAEKGIALLKKKNTHRTLYENPHFHSGYSVLCMTRLQTHVDKLHEEGYDLKIEGTSIQPDEEIQGFRSDTLHISLKINGQTEKLTLIKGSDVIKLDEKSVLLANSDAVGNEEQTYMTVDQVISSFEVFKNKHTLQKRSIPVQSGTSPKTP